MSSLELEAYFEPYRRNIVGYDQTFISPFGEQRIVYADWIASGRLYKPIEDTITSALGPFVGNTHSETSVTGTSMTRAYHEARRIIKAHVNAGENDMIIAAGTGMTGVINKLQRILGIRVPEQMLKYTAVPESERPVVLITHMEHHSNQTSWYETLADVIWLPPGENGLCDPNIVRAAAEEHMDRPLIGSFTACSNVTGLRTRYYEFARIMHEFGGVCFVDFAASAPYEPIDMHPADPDAHLDAVFFSPHKFLGGPGSSGIVVFDSALDPNTAPDHPGGGTVNWTNPWGEYTFVRDLEDREDGGTPGFLQTIKAALAIRLKEEMGVENMMAREEELLRRAWPGIEAIPGMHILAGHLRDRHGVISFYVDGIHYNLIVQILNDRFGVQVRGGCSCAGTYGHFLLHVDRHKSRKITDKIDEGDLSAKPGWVRLSMHPTMTNAEVDYLVKAIEETVANIEEWEKDYRYDPHTNEHRHIAETDAMDRKIQEWFDLQRIEAEAL